MAATSLAALPRPQRTTAAGRPRGAGPVVHRRACAVVTAASCGVHVWLALAGHHGPWLGLLMLALAAVCAPCAVHLWRHATAGLLRRVGAVAVAMTAVHTALLLGASGGEGAGHAHGGRPASYGVGVGSGAAELLLVIGMELVTGLLAATLLARLRRGLSRPTP